MSEHKEVDTTTSVAGSLNIMCAICSEFYKHTDNVYSTRLCGHLFHQDCLMRWLRQSTTCPQCRRSCNRSSIHRVYLNFGVRTEVDDEIDAAAATANLPNWLSLHPPTSAHPGPEPVPEGAIKAGTDPDGNDAYVARVYFEDDLLPASYIPQKGGAYAPWNCRAHFLRNDVEVLVDSECEWVTEQNGRVPDNAILTGYSETGENLYTGRAKYQGILLPGKIHPSHHVLYMPYKGQEVNTSEYEVLVRVVKQSPEQ